MKVARVSPEISNNLILIDSMLGGAGRVINIYRVHYCVMPSQLWTLFLEVARITICLQNLKKVEAESERDEIEKESERMNLR